MNVGDQKEITIERNCYEELRILMAQPITKENK
jgi:hypothetical protein